MKTTTTLTIALLAAPAALFAQQASATASASAQTSVTVPANYSAETRANIEASFKRAQEKNLPDQAMRERLAEGQAKAASDAQVATAVQKTEARLEASQSAMIRAGRKNPTPQEVNAGEQTMARGATEAQVEQVAKHAPSDRSLVVAFGVLTKLQAAGKPVDQAVAEITAKLDARATDDALLSLTGNGSASANANAHGNNPNAAGAASVAGDASAGVGAAAKGVGNAAAGVGAAVSGAVTGAIAPKKP
jgi:hypothetical protein